MKKALYLLPVLGLINACVSVTQNEQPVTGNTEMPPECPTVEVRSNDQKIVQKSYDKDAFLIEIIGHEGHCSFDENILKDKAVVAPRFKITRLSDTNIEDVHFSYYIETKEGPKRFLGRKTYFTNVIIPRGSHEVYHTPEKGELSIDPGKQTPDIYVGLNEDKSDLLLKTK